MPRQQTFTIWQYKQEEIVEKRLVADANGTVTEQEVFVQPYLDIKIILESTQLENLYDFGFEQEITLEATTGRGGGFTFYGELSKMWFGDANYGYLNYNYIQQKYKTITVGENTKIRHRIGYGYSSETSMRAANDIEGNVTAFRYRSRDQYPPILGGTVYFNLQNFMVNEQIVSYNNRSVPYSFEVELQKQDRAITPITADNFTDEGNPTFSYEARTGKSAPKGSTLEREDTITSLEAGLSFDGVTIVVPYRAIPISSSTVSYTFDLTEEEREALRIGAQGSSTVPIYYMTRIVRALGSETATLIGSTERNFTIIGAYPTLDPTVKDIKEETIALTGDENTFIRYESMAEFAINAQASKHAEIISQSVQCGSKIVNDLSVGIIEDVESGTFSFNIADSRNMGASSSLFRNLVEYVKPTCYQKISIELSGETEASVKVVVNGNYFNGSFGVADNTFKLEMRYTDDEGNMGEWQTINSTPVFNGTTYEVETTFTGFDYGKSYIFQSRVTDKLNVVESSQYTVRLLPAFDWSETDFNFNVPVNINGSLSMDNEQIIRHNKAANNTVLSATGGKVYVRPNGTEDTFGELVINSDGSVNMSGDLNVEGNIAFKEFSINGNTLADYVIETGEEAMGTNGTWYWRKWASGKSEAWGCRNFGNMAVTTAWGNLYRSAVCTQDLPEKVFVRTPDSININIVHSNYGGWICKHEQTAPSAVTTGSFIFVRPASATVTPTNIGFYIVGEWK